MIVLRYKVLCRGAYSFPGMGPFYTPHLSALRYLDPCAFGALHDPTFKLLSAPRQIKYHIKYNKITSYADVCHCMRSFNFYELDENYFIVECRMNLPEPFVVNHHRRSAQVWHVFSRDFTVLPAHPQCVYWNLLRVVTLIGEREVRFRQIFVRVCSYGVTSSSPVRHVRSGVVLGHCPSSMTPASEGSGTMALPNFS